MSLYLKNLEINVAEHCNLRCKGCDHSSPFLGRRFIDAHALTSWLAPLRGSRIGKLKLIGGEPLLHPQIGSLIRAARALAIADEIGVVTNGTLLHRVADEFWESIDFLQVSMYPGVAVQVSREELAEKSRMYGFHLAINDRTLFRHTVLHHPIDDEQLVERIYQRCELPRGLACHTLRDGRLFKCSPAAFSRDRLSLSGYDDDGLDLASLTNVEEEVTAYLADPHPLQACRYCLGTCGKDFAVVQQTAAELKAVRTESLPLATLLDRRRLVAEPVR